MFYAITTYILVGLIVSLVSEYKFGNREHAVNTVIDVALWPVMIFYWAKYGRKS